MNSEISRPMHEVSCVDIAALFARVGLTSFGGGLSAWLYREVVTQRGWLEEGEFLSAMTLGQILPGSNVVNLSVYVGYRMRGLPGSLVAVIALLAPPMIVIVLFTSAFSLWIRGAAVHEFLEGVAAAAVGMTASVGVRAAHAATGVRSWPLVLSIAVFVAVGVLRWPLVPVAVVAGTAGVLLSRRTAPDA
ncbi:chromate transporter [Paraburkholderia sp. J11-2]|uniref:chromate transporter n=1 Tax=Paraburkholderia sp. J11-2 TaxID=2805431 RepID=UPI002AB6C469|nr:chromate transporter [Paraburkholderia sp. J11-2]